MEDMEPVNLLTVFYKNEYQVKTASVRFKINATLRNSLLQDVVEDSKFLHGFKDNCINIRKSIMTNL